MAFNLASLTQYADQLAGKLIRQSLLQTPTAKLSNVQTNVKYTETINLLSNNLYTQTGISGWNASGTTNINQRSLTCAPIMVNQNFNLFGVNGLEQYFTGMFMKPGSGADGGTLPWEEVFVNYLAEQIEQNNERLIWQGNYAPSGVYSGDTGGVITPATSAGVYGFLSFIDSASFTGVTQSGLASGCTKISYSGAPTTANIGTIVDAFISNLPADILSQKKIYIYCSPAIVQTYKLYIRNLNLFHQFIEHTTEVDTLFQPVVGFMNIILVGTVGLVGINRMVCSYDTNFYIGTDLNSELSGNMFNLFWAAEAQELRFVYRGKLATQFAFPFHVVIY